MQHIQEITIGHHKIGPKYPPFMVAELSGNHNHSLDRVLHLVKAAKEAGAHAVKVQTYTPDTMTLDVHEGDFVIHDKKSLWYGKSLYELYQEASLPWEWHAEIFDYCRKLNLIPFSTPFDESAIDFLEGLNVPCYKIASLEIIDIPLIKRAAQTGKPLIISTGAATYQEIQEAVDAAHHHGCKDLILLKCTAAYPARPDSMNLRTIPDISKNFNTLVGLSDHTLGIGAAVASIVFGACLIEKHFTSSRAEGGVDSAFSLEPQEFKSLVIECTHAWQAMGEITYGTTPAEKTMHMLRRSLYFVQDLPENTTIAPEHIRAIRPGKGLLPKEYDHVIGCRTKCNVKRGEPVSWNRLIQP